MRYVIIYNGGTVGHPRRWHHLLRTLREHRICNGHLNGVAGVREWR